MGNPGPGHWQSCFPLAASDWRSRGLCRVAGCEGTTPKALIRHSKIGTLNVQGWDCRLLRHGKSRNVAARGGYSSTIWGTVSGPRRASDAAPLCCVSAKRSQKTGRFLRYIFIALLGGTCGPDWEAQLKWHLKMKIRFNLFCLPSLASAWAPKPQPQPRWHRGARI